MKSSITKKGYRIPYNNQEFNKIRQELTVKPIAIPDYDWGDNSFPVYRKSKNYIYMPKFYGLEKYGNPDEYEEIITHDINIHFEGSLRPKQINIVQPLLNHINTNHSAILCVGCGEGKTVMSLWTSIQLGKKIMVLVHKEFLLNQWIERIKEFIPSAKIGIVQQNNIDVENKDIVIGMIQSIVGT
jgi:superfamily II DNA or RNA helicase